MQKGLYCNNCGKYGHGTRTCKDPVTSIGIVCLRFSDEKLKETFLNNSRTSWFRDVGNTISTGNHYLYHAAEIHDKVKFLLIRRKHSLGFLEFIRGKYDVYDYNSISRLFQIMSTHEIDLINKADFTSIWNAAWCNPIGKYQEEFRKSEEKFLCLTQEYKERNILGLSYYTSQQALTWETPEWGFPKGRRNFSENNRDCALREFSEETGYETEDHDIVDPVTPMHEVFRGTNDILYKHTYYLSVLKNEKDPTLLESNIEVGDLGWFTYKEALCLLRPYHKEKKTLLNQIFRFVLTMCLDEKKEGAIRMDKKSDVSPNDATCPGLK